MDAADKRSKGLRILFVNQFYSPDVAATGQLLADMAEEQVQRGHEVHVVCSRHTYVGNKKIYPDNQIINGVHVHRVSATGFGRERFWGRALDYLSFHLWSWRRILALPRMDVCVSLTTPPFIGLIGAFLKGRKFGRLVLWNMDLYPEVLAAYKVVKKKGWLYRLLAKANKYVYSRADQIISLGEVMTQRLIGSGASREKIVTVHNWVPGEVIEPMPVQCSRARDNWNLNGQVTVMYSGNLGRGHDLTTVVQAVRQLDKQYNVRLVFVGQGSMEKSLRQLCSELEMDNVDFHEPQPLSFLADSMAAGHIHLVSQRPGTEGLILPCKLYGIMAAGRCILYNGPGDCEIARIVRASESGVIAPAGNVRALTGALKLLVKDKQLRENMGRRARRYYQNHFGRDRSIAVISEAITGKPFSKKKEAPEQQNQQTIINRQDFQLLNGQYATAGSVIPSVRHFADIPTPENTRI